MTRKLTWILGFGLVVLATGGALAQEDGKPGWTTLGGADWADTGGAGPMGGEFMTGELEPDFSEELQRLEGTVLALKGFMLPLDVGSKQQHFILSKFPIEHCRFCQPGGPQTMIEVLTKEPVEFSYEAVTVAGKLRLVTEDDPLGLLFRMTDAAIVD